MSAKAVVRLASVLVATVLAMAVVCVVRAPAGARADGDPASDVLVGENVFYPYSPAVSAGLQKQLNAETAAAAQAHFPIKVALIPAPADLGALPTLFGKPVQYAHFLDQEISFLSVKPLLLVVMPNGYGVVHVGAAATRVAATLKDPVSSHSDDIARAAIAALPKLAAAAGHPIAAVSGSAAGSGSGSGSGSGAPSPVLAVAVLAAVAVAAAAVISRIRGSGTRYRRGRSGRSS